MDTTILISSFRTPHLLEAQLPNLMASRELPGKVIVVLNECDERSFQAVVDNGAVPIALAENIGPAAVDHALPMIDSEYVCNIYNDMFFHDGWDKMLVDLLEEHYPASASTCMVETAGGGHSVWNFDNTLRGFDPSIAEKFKSRWASGHYKTYLKYSFNHPIMCRTSDYFKVNGYSNNFEEMWIRSFGKGLDTHFAWRLWKLHNKQFKFVMSDKAFVYHAGSQTLGRIHPAYIARHQAYFQEQTGMTEQEFHEIIRYGEAVR